MYERIHRFSSLCPFWSGIGYGILAQNVIAQSIPGVPITCVAAGFPVSFVFPPLEVM